MTRSSVVDTLWCHRSNHWDSYKTVTWLLCYCTMPMSVNYYNISSILVFNLVLFLPRYLDVFVRMNNWGNYFELKFVRMNNRHGPQSKDANTIWMLIVYLFCIYYITGTTSKNKQQGQVFFIKLPLRFLQALMLGSRKTDWRFHSIFKRQRPLKYHLECNSRLHWKESGNPLFGFSYIKSEIIWYYIIYRY